MNNTMDILFDDIRRYWNKDQSNRVDSIPNSAEKLFPGYAKQILQHAMKHNLVDRYNDDGRITFWPSQKAKDLYRIKQNP